MKTMRPGILLVLAALPLLAGASSEAWTQSPLVRAMQDELRRTTGRLTLEGFTTPYYASYTVLDTRTVHCAGQDGGLAAFDRAHFRHVLTDVRVGDYDFDSSHTNYALAYPTQLPLEDDYTAIRRALWLSTDDAYKSAVESLEKKRARQSRQIEEPQATSFSRQPAPAKIVEGEPPSLDGIDCRPLAQRLSTALVAFERLHSAEVTIEARSNVRYFVSTEGALGREPESFARVGIVGRAEAEDGTELVDFVSFEAATYEELPDPEKLEEAARELGRRLEATVQAEKAKRYTGPILFEERAAAQLVRRMLDARLSGTPPLGHVMFSESEQPRSNALRIGRQIFPTAFDVVDDPTRARHGDLPLFGRYDFDHEGVLPEAVELVENGRVETLLMSRTPNEDLARSNGHGRYAGSIVRGQIANLIVTADGGRDRRALERELLERAKREGLDHAYVVTLLDDQEVTADVAGKGSWFGDGGDTILPLVAYRVDLKGERTPVRNVELVAPLVRDLRHLAAWGDAPRVDHQLGIHNPGFGYYSAYGLMTPSSVVSPDLLFEEVELRVRPAGGQPRRLSPP